MKKLLLLLVMLSGMIATMHGMEQRTKDVATQTDEESATVADATVSQALRTTLSLLDVIEEGFFYLVLYEYLTFDDKCALRDVCHAMERVLLRSHGREIHIQDRGYSGENFGRDVVEYLRTREQNTSNKSHLTLALRFTPTIFGRQLSLCTACNNPHNFSALSNIVTLDLLCVDMETIVRLLEHCDRIKNLTINTSGSILQSTNDPASQELANQIACKATQLEKFSCHRVPESFCKVLLQAVDLLTFTQLKSLELSAISSREQGQTKLMISIFMHSPNIESIDCDVSSVEDEQDMDMLVESIIQKSSQLKKFYINVGNDFYTKLEKCVEERAVDFPNMMFFRADNNISSLSVVWELIERMPKLRCLYNNRLSEYPFNVPIDVARNRLPHLNEIIVYGESGRRLLSADGIKRMMTRSNFDLTQALLLLRYYAKLEVKYTDSHDFPLAMDANYFVRCNDLIISRENLGHRSVQFKSLKDISVLALFPSLQSLDLNGVYSITADDFVTLLTKYPYLKQLWWINDIERWWENPSAMKKVLNELANTSYCLQCCKNKQSWASMKITFFVDTEEEIALFKAKFPHLENDVRVPRRTVYPPNASSSAQAATVTPPASTQAASSNNGCIVS